MLRGERSRGRHNPITRNQLSHNEPAGPQEVWASGPIGAPVCSSEALRNKPLYSPAILTPVYISPPHPSFPLTERRTRRSL
ncbi:hypothetical protein EYF80_029551 [Liparis tanakae]|uniref:Uncharacterized protein n=1 Tax=Liparis tanakae TaxID=230148 RepID=A0A4Z2H334_9TELE|nr:hypothetical protein EYF80_029551 [Liparis tanakae]